jgi:hypothetical protein
LAVLKPVFEGAEDTVGDEVIIDEEYSSEAGKAIDGLFPDAD